jgi:hypothetical protein
MPILELKQDRSPLRWRFIGRIEPRIPELWAQRPVGVHDQVLRMAVVGLRKWANALPRRVLARRIALLPARWLLNLGHRVALDLLVAIIGAVLLYWMATTLGWISSETSSDAQAFRAVQRYAGKDEQLQWDSVDLHGLGSKSLVVLVRPSAPILDRHDPNNSVVPYVVILDPRSSSFLDRIAQRQPGYFEAYRLRLLEPARTYFGWDANMRLVPMGEGEPPAIVVEWSSPIADDVLRAVTVTSWNGVYSTSYPPSPLQTLGIAEPFSHLGHPRFSDGTSMIDGWYLNDYTDYAFLEADGDPGTEFALIRALEFAKGYTYDGECRACPHRYVIAMDDVSSSHGVKFEPLTWWNQSQENAQLIPSPTLRGTFAITNITAAPATGLRTLVLDEIHRRQPKWWPQARALGN